MVNLKNTWNIKRGNYICNNCNKKIEEEEYFFSCLVEHDIELERKNFCLDCWDPDIGLSAFSFWKARLPKKDNKKRIIIDDEIIFNLFERFISQEDEKRLRFGFILSLILMQKRRLKFCNIEKRQGRDFLILRSTRNNKVYSVPDMHMNEDEIEEVKEELNKILELPE